MPATGNAKVVFGTNVPPYGGKFILRRAPWRNGGAGEKTALCSAYVHSVNNLYSATDRFRQILRASLFAIS